MMKVIITFAFCCDNLWKSKFMALEKPRKLRELFYSYFVAALVGGRKGIRPVKTE